MKKPIRSPKKTLLVDADILLFKFGCSAEETFTFGEEDSVLNVRELSEVKEALWEFLKDLRETTRTKDFILCLTSPNCFRYDILPSYKHNRKNNEKPILYQSLKEHMLQEYECKLKPRLEADDVMGILSTKNPGKYIIATIDKDLKQIPGWHFNWNKDSSCKFVGEDEADLMFYKQCLTGDTTDGFSGCPGIGPKNAEKILKDVEKDSYWDAICEAYLKKGLDESYALTQARMARILRENDYDFETQTVKEWLP
jgi:DNA polymerase-1